MEDPRALTKERRDAIVEENKQRLKEIPNLADMAYSPDGLEPPGMREALCRVQRSTTALEIMGMIHQVMESYNSTRTDDDTQIVIEWMKHTYLGE